MGQCIDDLRDGVKAAIWRVGGPDVGRQGGVERLDVLRHGPWRQALAIFEMLPGAAADALRNLLVEDRSAEDTSEGQALRSGRTMPFS